LFYQLVICYENNILTSPITLIGLRWWGPASHECVKPIRQVFGRRSGLRKFLGNFLGNFLGLGKMLADRAMLS
jgi:hypothetical protein